MSQCNVSAVVLAGGASSRMGQNKALMRLGQKNMLERVIEPLRTVFEEIIIVTNNPEEYSMMKDVKFTKDCMEISTKNSLVGILSGLHKASNPYIFVVACDMPFLNPALLRYMVDALKEEDILIPVVRGFLEPLHGIYGKGCIPIIKQQLNNKNYKIVDFFKYLEVKRISEECIKELDPELLSFININTYEEYKSYIDRFS